MHVSVLGNTDDSMVVTVRGNLDGDSATVLRTTLDQALERPQPRIVVDLSGIGSCDATGLDAFVDGHRRAGAAGGWIRLAAPGPELRAVIDAAGPIGVYPTVAEALAARDDAA